MIELAAQWLVGIALVAAIIAIIVMQEKGWM